MFGARLRTWMETHIGRSRKKAQRNKEDKKADSKLTNSSVSGHFECDSFEKKYAKKGSKAIRDAGDPETKSSDFSLPSQASMSFDHNTGRSTVNNLSSPESAYSTGYSTDGTSPGASVPPEYYINIRTGTHYFHSNPVVTAPSPSRNIDKGDSVSPPVTINVFSPKSSRRKRDDDTKKSTKHNDALPESSTEEDITDRLVSHRSLQPMSTAKAKIKIAHEPLNCLHRRTESCDESQQGSALERGNPVPGYQCASPYLPGASPRQRNRIRTNPWLGTDRSKAYNAQAGETSSNVGSNSTLSSSGCKRNSDDNSLRLTKEHLWDIKNCNTIQQSAVFSPVSNSKKHLYAVTTCSPQPNRACHHILRPKTSSSSSDLSSATNDEHGNTSDFSEDDVTLNELLGKFDESYVYEKETDILSDSEPTDCEDQVEEEIKTDNNNLDGHEHHTDFDFIDNGSQTELAHSDPESSSKVQGHCTYHQLPGHSPELPNKQIPRQSTRKRDRQSCKSSKKRGNSRKHLDSPILSNKITNRTYTRRSSQIFDNNNSCSSLTRLASPQLPNGMLRKADSVLRSEDNSPKKQINLNRVLMERFISNQRNGTRSADGTPVSLRRRAGPSNYNGKYIKNQYVCNLISSDASFNAQRIKLEKTLACQNREENKTRLNTLSVNSNHHITSESLSSVECGLNVLDREGDLKYRQLIQEAEHIIEDLKVKSKSPQYLSPTFRCKNGMERAKPSSPLVFSVPPSPLSLRYDVYTNTTHPSSRYQQLSNNNSVSELPKATSQKEKNIDNEDSLLKTISKTLERIIIGGASDTNRRLDKSVSDPFAKNKKKLVLPANVTMYSNRINQTTNQQNTIYSANVTPDLLRSSSTDSAPQHASTLNSDSNVNQSEMYHNQSGLSRFFQRSPKYKTSSFDEHLNKHNFQGNGCCFNPGLHKSFDDQVGYGTDDLYYLKPKQACNQKMYQQTRSQLEDFNPNSNVPYFSGFRQIPWQHRNSQAKRFKYLSDLQNLPKHKTYSSEMLDMKPSLANFRTFDLGHTYADSSRYCPQSEPVKRKIYTCSATFDKLQKTLMRKQLDISSCKKTRDGIEPGEKHQIKVLSRVGQLRRKSNAQESKADRILFPPDMSC